MTGARTARVDGANARLGAFAAAAGGAGWRNSALWEVESDRGAEEPDELTERAVTAGLKRRLLVQSRGLRMRPEGARSRSA